MDKLIFFLLFVLPFMILPIGTSPFEAPKVYVAEIGISILLLWYLVKHPVKDLLRARIRKGQFRPEADQPLAEGALGILGVVGVMHLFLSPSPTLLFGNPFRMSGVFLFELLLLFAVLAQKIPVRIPSEKVIILLLGLQLVAAILIQTKVDNRAIGTLGEANSLAAYVIFLLPWLILQSKGDKGSFGQRPISLLSQRLMGLWLRLRGGRGYGRIIGLIIGIIIILFSGSRSGVIALGIMGSFYLLQRFSVKLAVIVSFLLFAISLFLPFLERGQLFENRATIWQTAVAAGSAKPLLGWGPGNTETALGETARKIGNAVQYEYVDHAHNIILEYWVIGGLIGVGAFLYLLSGAFITFYREKELQKFVALFGLLIMLSFNPLSVAILLQFWWLIGEANLARGER